MEFNSNYKKKSQLYFIANHSKRSLFKEIICLINHFCKLFYKIKAFFITERFLFKIGQSFIDEFFDSIIIKENCSCHLNLF